MKIPRNVHGEDLARHLQKRWRYVRSHQTGSHIIMRTLTPTQHTLSVPAHKPMKTGTLDTILKLVADHKNVNVEDVLEGL